MQFKSILAILSVAFVATAIPLEQQAPRDLFERNSGGPTCTQAQANSLCTAAGNPITAASGIVGILAAILGIPIGDIVVGISNVACSKSFISRPFAFSLADQA